MLDIPSPPPNPSKEDWDQFFFSYLAAAVVATRKDYQPGSKLCHGIELPAGEGKPKMTPVSKRHAFRLLCGAIGPQETRYRMTLAGVRRACRHYLKLVGAPPA